MKRTNPLTAVRAWGLALTCLLLALPATAGVESLSPENAFASVAQSRGVVLVDVYAEF